MHYYNRNLGDYAKKCGRLTMLQHGAYTLLIDSCYDREQFPNFDEAIEWTWAGTDAEIEAVKFVLSRFFKLNQDGRYIQERIQSEILKYREKSDKNRLIAIERETKRREFNTNRAANNTKRVRNVNESPPNQEPITNNQYIKKEKILKEKNPDFVFVLPDWIDKSDWELWIKSRKKKMLPEQMQRQVNKLRKWKDAGNDHAGALQQAAENGYTGLFLPDSKQGKFQSAAKTRLDEFDRAASEFLAGGENPLLGVSDG